LMAQASELFSEPPSIEKWTCLRQNCPVEQPPSTPADGSKLAIGARGWVCGAVNAPQKLYRCSARARIIATVPSATFWRGLCHQLTTTLRRPWVMVSGSRSTYAACSLFGGPFAQDEKTSNTLNGQWRPSFA
jgi:hypothetical protein